MRTINTCGSPGVAEVADPDDGEHLTVRFHLATFSSIMEQVERVRSTFRLNDDAKAATDHLGKDRWLGPVVRACPGLRLPGAWDRFETSIRIIVGQQVSVVGASTTTGRIASRYGSKIETALPAKLKFLFPGATRFKGPS